MTLNKCTQHLDRKVVTIRCRHMRSKICKGNCSQLLIAVEKDTLFGCRTCDAAKDSVVTQKIMEMKVCSREQVNAVMQPSHSTGSSRLNV